MVCACTMTTAPRIPHRVFQAPVAHLYANNIFFFPPPASSFLLDETTGVVPAVFEYELNLLTFTSMSVELFSPLLAPEEQYWKAADLVVDNRMISSRYSKDGKEWKQDWGPVETNTPSH